MSHDGLRIGNYCIEQIDMGFAPSIVGSTHTFYRWGLPVTIAGHILYDNDTKPFRIEMQHADGLALLNLLATHPAFLECIERSLNHCFPPVTEAQ